MPADNFVKVMRVQIADGKSLLEVCGSKSLSQVLAEAGHAMRTMAIVPVKVVRNETVHPLRNPVADPCFEHLAPMRIIQTGPILAHAANAVSLARDWLSRFVLLQQFQWVGDGLWTEQLFVPLRAIESEKSARPLGTIWIADQKFYVHVANHLNATPVQFGVEAGEPLATLAVAAHRQIRRVPAAKWRIGQAPEVCSVKTYLRDLRLCVID